MKKIVSLILVITLCFFPTRQVKAEESSFEISEVAIELLTSALNHNEFFNLPDLQGKELYLCSPINPYFLDGTILQANQEVEYYLVEAEDKYIACITLCYKDGIAVSAALNTEIALALNDNIDNNGFLFIVNEGKLYLKTEQGVVRSSDAEEKNARISSEDNHFISVANEAQWSPCHLVVKERLPLISARTISPRSRILSVPYVSQGNYDLCWAAAAAAFGRYYTGSTYSQYDPYALASIVGVGNNGAGIDKAMEILKTVFHIDTVYVAPQMSMHTIVTHINEGRPILVGFSNDTVGHMVVVCGFDDSGENMQYYVRDSNTPAMQIVITLYSNGPIVMDYYSNMTMYWNEAAYRN